MTIKRRTFVLLKMWGLGIFITALLIGAGYVYFKTPFLTITSYELVGVPDMYKDTIQSNLRAIASQRRFKIFPSNRIISYRGMVIKSSIVDVLPNTATITFSRTSLHTLKIIITNYVPVFKLDETRGVTIEGIIYPEFKDIHDLPTLFIASSTMEEIQNDGVRATKISGIKKDTLTTLSKFIQKINTSVFTISKVYIDGYGDVTLYNYDATKKVIYSSDTDIDKVWSNVVSAIDTEPLKSKLTDPQESLEYLDARFGNKVFYKFTNGEKSSIIKNHEATSTATTSISR